MVQTKKLPPKRGREEVLTAKVPGEKTEGEGRPSPSEYMQGRFSGLKGAGYSAFWLSRYSS